MLQRYRLLSWLILGIGLCLFSSSSVIGADGSEIQLRLVPDTVLLAPGESAQILVTVRNPYTDTLHDLHLSTFSNMDIVLPPVHTATILQSDSTLAWTVNITRPSLAMQTGEVYFRLDYAYTQDGMRQANTDCVVSVLHIQERIPKTAEQVATVHIETALETVQEDAPETIYLIVHNNAAPRLEVTRIVTQIPSFLSINVSAPKTTLNWGETQIFTVSLKSLPRIAPKIGKHLLLFQVHLAWQDAGTPRSGILLASQPFEVGISGMTGAILTLVGVPVFGLLPGAIMLITFVFLWKRISPKTSCSLDVNLPESTVVAITLSLIVYIVYRWGIGRDYLLAYGLYDVYLVWFTSLMTAGVAWGIYHLWSGQRKRTRFFTEKDAPLKVLEKLQRNHQTLPTSQARIGQEETAQQCFVVFCNPDNPAQIWVAPPIRYTFAAELDSAQREKIRSVLESKDVKHIHATLKQAHKKQLVRLEWRHEGRVQHLQKYDKQQVEILENLAPRAWFEDAS